MANYFVFENEETKERVLVKSVYHRRLHMYKLRNNVPVVKNIDWAELGELTKKEKLSYIGHFSSNSNIPAPIHFEKV